MMVRQAGTLPFNNTVGRPSTPKTTSPDFNVAPTAGRYVTIRVEERMAAVGAADAAAVVGVVAPTAVVAVAGVVVVGAVASAAAAAAVVVVTEVAPDADGCGDAWATLTENTSPRDNVPSTEVDSTRGPFVTLLHWTSAFSAGAAVTVSVDVNPHATKTRALAANTAKVTKPTDVRRRRLVSPAPSFVSSDWVITLLSVRQWG